MAADILIKNAKCLTMKDGKTADWVTIHNGKILALGYHAAESQFVNENTVVIDAGGNTVLPGFIDSHFHVVQTALNARSLNLSKGYSFEEIGLQIQRAAQEKPGQSIIGIRLQVEQLKEKKFPDRLILDRYCSDVPVWINCLDYQVSMLNTYGLLYYKVPFNMEGVDKDSQDVATGIFRGKANAVLRTNILDGIPDKVRKEAVLDIIPELLATGITTVNAMEGGYMYSDKDADFIFECSSEFPVDMALFYQSLDVEKMKRMNLNRIGGSFYVDGTMGARTAALSFEYADCPGRMGSLRYTQAELNEFVMECYKNNLQLSLYTIGDRAIGAALKAHEYALYQTGVTGLRHRLEHVELASTEHIQQAKKMGIIFSMNPTYETYWGGPDKMYSKRLGDKFIRTNMFREIIDQGVCLVGGSDSDITEYNPMIGIAAAVNHPVKQHRITVYEALELYTSKAAYAIFEEQQKGTLEAGKTADIVVLDRDILSTPHELLDQVKVIATIKSGDILYNALG
ncbi:amidohydrolase [Clostridium aminobutyricum]|uniref:Amidohydrolase n=1 Tax=Clostridium aminobutyricum TaxID=33953 RepID=A0A939IJP3_CLOAM|nr:amidohydrolase [Clostridium aminobutyricum]MBN7773803.1 amidohydrolase [Clostridium aminobutyricum]